MCRFGCRRVLVRLHTAALLALPAVVPLDAAAATIAVPAGGSLQSA